MPPQEWDALLSVSAELPLWLAQLLSEQAPYARLHSGSGKSPTPAVLAKVSSGIHDESRIAYKEAALLGPTVKIGVASPFHLHGSLPSNYKDAERRLRTAVSRASGRSLAEAA